MIEINLIPINLRRKDGQGDQALASINIPQEVLLGVGGTFVFILLLIHFTLLVLWGIKASRHASIQTSWQKMSSEKADIDTTNSNVRDVKSKIKMIANDTYINLTGEKIPANDKVLKNTIFWSHKLNILSDLLPKGVWFTKITLNNNILTIEGSAFSKLNDEISIAGNFVSSLKKEDQFAKDFSSIELNSVTRTKKGETEEADFVITAKLK